MLLGALLLLLGMLLVLEVLLLLAVLLAASWQFHRPRSNGVVFAIFTILKRDVGLPSVVVLTCRVVGPDDSVVVAVVDVAGVLDVAAVVDAATAVVDVADVVDIADVVDVAAVMVALETGVEGVTAVTVEVVAGGT